MKNYSLIIEKVPIPSIFHKKNIKLQHISIHDIISDLFYTTSNLIPSKNKKIKKLYDV